MLCDGERRTRTSDGARQRGCARDLAARCHSQRAAALIPSTQHRTSHATTAQSSSVGRQQTSGQPPRASHCRTWHAPLRFASANQRVLRCRPLPTPWYVAQRHKRCTHAQRPDHEEAERRRRATPRCSTQATRLRYHPPVARRRKRRATHLANGDVKRPLDHRVHNLHIRLVLAWTRRGRGA